MASCEAKDHVLEQLKFVRCFCQRMYFKIKVFQIIRIFVKVCWPADRQEMFYLFIYNRLGGVGGREGGKKGRKK